MKREVWKAKPNEVVKACGPEELAKQGVIVNPFSLPKSWGLRAAYRYMKAQGMTPKAIKDVTRYHIRSL